MRQIDLLIFTFPDEAYAQKALQVLDKLELEKVIKIVNTAILRKDANGKIHITEQADPGRRRGAIFGAIAGGLVGLLAGPIGSIVGAASGAGVGSIAAEKIDMGIPNKRLSEIAEGLGPNESGIVALIDQVWANSTAAKMKNFDPEDARQIVRDEITSQLQIKEGSIQLETINQE